MKRILVDTRWSSFDHWCIQWRVHSLEWVDVQFRDDSSSKSNADHRTAFDGRLLGPRFCCSSNDLVQQRTVDVNRRSQRIREVLAIEYEQRQSLSSTYRSGARIDVRSTNVGASDVELLLLDSRPTTLNSPVVPTIVSFVSLTFSPAPKNVNYEVSARHFILTRCSSVFSHRSWLWCEMCRLASSQRFTGLR